MLLPLPKKVFAAVEAVLYIAYSGSPHPISAKEIATRQDLPPRYLEQIMQKLVRAGLLRGVRGPRGGYLLAKERRRITIGDICEILQEETTAETEAEIACTALGRAVVLPLWQRAGNVLLAQLRDINLASLCEEAEAKAVAKGGATRLDFTI